MRKSKSQEVASTIDPNKKILRKLIIGRFGRSIVVAFWVMVISFLLLRLSPGDPVRIALGTDYTEANVKIMRAKLGLDGNIITQFFHYLKHLLQGDLGTSYFSGIPVTQILKVHLPVTLTLIVFSVLLALVVAIPLALAIALSKRQIVTYIFRAVTSISLAIPAFFLALIGLLYFGSILNWAPAAGYQGAFPANLHYLWLPAVVNCASLVPVLSRVLHSSLIDTLDQEFVETGVIRGVSKIRFYWSYLLRPSLAPTVVLLSYMIGVMIGGTVIMETIFSLPGIGRELITAVGGKDYPVVQGVVLTFGLLVVFSSFIGDLLGYFLDRRVTLS
jgi:peptide/nickel transport system permease protein